MPRMVIQRAPPASRWSINKMTPQKQRRAIRITEVKAMTGMGRSTIYKLESESKFPRRFKVSERLSVWFADEISDWLEQRAEQRPAQAA